MAAKSRRKGATGERELVALCREHGFAEAHRVSPMQAGHATSYPDVGGVPLLWIEAKRRRKANVGGLAREFLEVERPGYVPALFYRDDDQPWRVVLDASEFLKLLRKAVPLPPQIRTVEIE